MEFVNGLFPVSAADAFLVFAGIDIVDANAVCKASAQTSSFDNSFFFMMSPLKFVVLTKSVESCADCKSVKILQALCLLKLLLFYGILQYICVICQKNV